MASTDGIFPPTPVYIRVGDGEEHEVGSFAPDVTMDGPTMTIHSTGAVAALLRGVADYMEGKPA